MIFFLELRSGVTDVVPCRALKHPEHLGSEKHWTLPSEAGDPGAHQFPFACISQSQPFHYDAHAKFVARRVAKFGFGTMYDDVGHCCTRPLSEYTGSRMAWKRSAILSHLKFYLL